MATEVATNSQPQLLSIDLRPPWRLCTGLLAAKQGDGHGQLVLVAERDIMTEPIVTAPAVHVENWRPIEPALYGGVCPKTRWTTLVPTPRVRPIFTRPISRCPEAQDALFQFGPSSSPTAFRPRSACGPFGSRGPA